MYNWSSRRYSTEHKWQWNHQRRTKFFDVAIGLTTLQKMLHAKNSCGKWRRNLNVWQSCTKEMKTCENGWKSNTWRQGTVSKKDIIIIGKPLLRDSLNVLCTIVVNFWQCHNITPLGATLERYAQQSSRKIAIRNFISRPSSASIDRYNKARRIYSRTLFSIRACE